MDRVSIESGFRLTVPRGMRAGLHIGDELLITTDHVGRIVLINEKRVREILRETAGMWRGRKDIPSDGVEYVNKIRKSRRLQRLGVTRRASHR